MHGLQPALNSYYTCKQQHLQVLSKPLVVRFPCICIRPSVTGHDWRLLVDAIAGWSICLCNALVPRKFSR